MRRSKTVKRNVGGPTLKGSSVNLGTSGTPKKKDAMAKVERGLKNRNKNFWSF